MVEQALYETSCCTKGRRWWLVEEILLMISEVFV